MGFASLCGRIGGICAPFIVVYYNISTLIHPYRPSTQKYNVYKYI